MQRAVPPATSWTLKCARKNGFATATISPLTGVTNGIELRAIPRGRDNSLLLLSSEILTLKLIGLRSREFAETSMIKTKGGMEVFC